MSKQASVNLVLIAIIIGLLTAGTIWYERRQAYFGEQVLVGPKMETVDIYIEPDDTATRAAARYLAYAIEQTLGTAPVIVTEKDEGRQYISILYDENMTESSDREKKAEIIIVAAAANAVKPAQTELSIYTISLERDNMVITVSRREDCFAAVKAVADRWLQKDCGLENAGELRISNRMIQEQLLGLPLEFDGEIRVLSQNLRYIDDANGNSVEERAQRFEKLVREYQPDLIGTQECTFQWLQLLKDVFSEEYEVFGCSRLGPQSEEEEWNAVLYRKDRFSFLEGDTFWLSNTPGEVASKLNYEGCVRICTWLLLQDNKTGKHFLFSNTHLQDGDTDYFRDVRERQAEVLLRQLRKGLNRLANEPGFLTGDFNGGVDEPFYAQVTGTYQDARLTTINNESAVDYSYHAYGDAHALIDFCFCSPKSVTVLEYRILDNQYDGYVSDHYGILVTALLNGS